MPLLGTEPNPAKIADASTGDIEWCSLGKFSMLPLESFVVHCLYLTRKLVANHGRQTFKNN